jgi:hypothetical protein
MASLNFGKGNRRLSAWREQTLQEGELTVCE